MGRYRRPYLPGALFHLTARTLKRERLFNPAVRSGAFHDLVTVAPASRCRLLAVAMMSNHLHLVVQQGELPLAALMQPFLRRLALRTQRAHDRDGPVFWRHYAAVACLDPRHARNVIVYTHLNPVRAGICVEPSAYPWTSHDLYALASAGRTDKRSRPLAEVLDPALGLSLFAATPGQSVKSRRANYRAVIDWRLRMDRAGMDPDPTADDAELMDAPAAAWAEASSWGAALSPLFHAPARLSTDDPGAGSPAPDMATIARTVLAVEAPDVPLRRIRQPGAGRRQTHLRRAIIRRLHRAGYRNVQIARFLGVSESTVSNAVRQAEMAAPR